MQSGYHNLPAICGTDQKDGEEYRAENVVTELTGTEPSISMELAAAYPDAGAIVPGLTYSRKVTLKSLPTLSYWKTTQMRKMLFLILLLMKNLFFFLTVNSPSEKHLPPSKGLICLP